MKLLAYIFMVSHISGGVYAYNFFSSEVFVLPLTPYNFSFSSSSEVSYRPSLLNLPDLPSWLRYTYSGSMQMGYVYGAPPFGETIVNLEVIAIDKSTYNTSRRIFNINVMDDLKKQYEIQFKINNLNVDELLMGTRLERLKHVIVEDLWPESRNNGAFTSLIPASEKGDRMPLSPTDREGVYVSYGTSLPFSYALNELEMEVKPLWNHQPCPKYFKKASYERFFRLKGFAIDWCSFKLYQKPQLSIQKVAKDESYAYLQSLHSKTIDLMRTTDVITRSYVLDVINTLLIPLLVMLVLLALLTLAMCCHRTDMMPTIHDIQMVQYAGLQRGSSGGRGRKFAKGQSPHPSQGTTTTHIDTLPRSQTTSPASTLNRTTPSRRFEDYETLSRPEPPPYQRPNDPQL